MERFFFVFCVDNLCIPLSVISPVFVLIQHDDHLWKFVYSQEIFFLCSRATISFFGAFFLLFITYWIQLLSILSLENQPFNQPFILFDPFSISFSIFFIYILFLLHSLPFSFYNSMFRPSFFLPFVTSYLSL